METCISHRKGAEVNAKTEIPSSVFIPISVDLIPLYKIRPYQAHSNSCFASIYFVGDGYRGRLSMQWQVRERELQFREELRGCNKHLVCSPAPHRPKDSPSIRLWPWALLQHLLPPCLIASQTSPVQKLDIYPSRQGFPKSWNQHPRGRWP